MDPTSSRFPRAGRDAPSCAVLFVTALLVACQSGPPPTPLDRGHAAFAEGRTKEAGALYEEAIRQGSGRVASGGPLVVDTTTQSFGASTRSRKFAFRLGWSKDGNTRLA